MEKWYYIGVNGTAITGTDDYNTAKKLYNAICTTVAVMTYRSKAKRAYKVWYYCEEKPGVNKEKIDETVIIFGRGYSTEDFNRYYSDCKYAKI